ncbi:MAG: SUMF1/EgtB/PvdO family nonheme iron enzyme, partial [Deltaproteobacteria bacterium]|nr:SUMF1/EgtB/PvdO family nonheme iron enzyme [Deltaproteobacteria bacterium]
GSYLLTLRQRGFRDVRYPVFIRRAEHWEGPPVRMLTDAQIGADWVYVPAGPFMSCGDSGALEARPAERPTLPGFLIRRLPLSAKDYCDFVNGLHRVDPEAAWEHVPCSESGVKESGSQYWEKPGVGEQYVVPTVDKDGDPWDPRWPALGINWHHAQRCAQWMSETTGWDVRLPSLHEWEKAARGVDGRIWPWGDRFDSTLARIRTSRPGRPQPEPVGAYPTDVSVYGMRDAAGCIRELCGDATFYGNDMLRPVVGASWNHLPDAARCASRLGTSHWNRSPFLGFRLVRGLPGA